MLNLGIVRPDEQGLISNPTGACSRPSNMPITGGFKPSGGFAGWASWDRNARLFELLLPGCCGLLTYCT